MAAQARRILGRLEFHYTPKHANWFNMVETAIGVLRGQCLDRRSRLVDEVAASEATPVVPASNGCSLPSKPASNSPKSTQNRRPWGHNLYVEVLVEYGGLSGCPAISVFRLLTSLLVGEFGVPILPPRARSTLERPLAIDKMSKALTPIWGNLVGRRDAQQTRPSTPPGDLLGKMSGAAAVVSTARQRLRQHGIHAGVRRNRSR